MSGAELFARANDAYFDDDFDEALDLYTQAIQAEPDKGEFLLRRCQVYQKMDKKQEAYNDAEKALTLLVSSQGSRSLLARAHLQKGITLHRLDRYKEAQTHLEQSEDLNPSEKTLATWLRKNSEKIPKEPETPAPAPIQPAAVAANTPQSARVRHEWFQNDAFVTVEVFMKNIKADAVDLDFFEKTMSLTIKMPTGSDYNLELDPLAHPIDPKQSQFKILSTKLEIKLKKQTEGILWGALESDSDMGTTMNTSTSSRPNKDWNKVVSEIEKDQEDPKGEQAVNDLFQQIYKNSDDDTRRAMMKSFVESNGTCLSTNWKEVGAGTVETKPPEGLVAKSWTQ
ncbi:SGS-domain-containing protein [Hesseltinella vesiculosa]|uniref:SGS-domain-containing protein n=1 Tax=Hesseltinella vesiculosa TaxID=101127 RepID=A0A1X2GPH5_9FUNG|nr:SGS-domain-containing protein [Hesseltinella vesiculosa]